MLAINKKGQAVSISDSDPLTGTRELKSVIASSPEKNMTLYSEAEFERKERNEKVEAMMKFGRAQMQKMKKEKEIKQIEKFRDQYNHRILNYQVLAEKLQNEAKRNADNSVEKAAIQYIMQPFDKVNFLDSGFKTPLKGGEGIANVRPSTDFETVVAGDPVGYETIDMPMNPLSNKDSVRLTEKEFNKEMGGLMERGVGFLNLDTLWSTAKDTAQTEAEKRLQAEIQQALNPQPGTPPPPQVQTVVVPGTTTVVSSGMDQKKMIMIVGGIVGIAALAVVGSALLKRK